MTDTAEPRRRSTDGPHTNPFQDPRFLLQLAVFVASIVGAMFAAYLVTQSRTTALESAAANLDKMATKLETQLSSIATSVQTIALESRSQQEQIKSREREIAEAKSTMQMLEARIVSLEKAMGRVEARTER